MPKGARAGRPRAHRQKARRWETTPWEFRGCAVVLDVHTGAVLAMSACRLRPRGAEGRTAADRAYQRQLQLEGGGSRLSALAATRGTSTAQRRGVCAGQHVQGADGAGVLDSGTARKTPLMNGVSTAMAVMTSTGRASVSAAPATRWATASDMRLARQQQRLLHRWSRDLGPTPAQAWETLRGYAEQLGSACRRRLLVPPRRTAHEEVWAPGHARDRAGRDDLRQLIARTAAITSARQTGDAAPLRRAMSGRSRSISPQAGVTACGVWCRKRGTAASTTCCAAFAARAKPAQSRKRQSVPDHAWFAGFAPRRTEGRVCDPGRQQRPLRRRHCACHRRVRPRHLQRTGVLGQVE